MIWLLIYITIFYFLLGLVAIIVINKTNKNAPASDRWTKYIFYIFVVTITLSSIYFNYLYVLGWVITTIGLFEIFWAYYQSKKNSSLLVKALIVYIPIAVAFILHTRNSNTDQLLYVYTIVFVFDGFAQIVGQLFGKKKILPTISPDKTQAGIIGGYICALLTSVFIKDYFPVSYWQMLLVTLVVSFSAMMGDTLASLFKRKCGIKDYSNLIPGHGGILDRFDSYLLAGAVFWIISIVNV